MLLDEEEIDKEMLKLAKLLQPKAFEKILSHLNSINRKVEDLMRSRAMWRERANKAKKEE